MNTKILSILSAGAIAVASTSCDGEWTPPAAGGEGTAALSSMTVKNDDAEKIIRNSASRADATDFSSYKVEIAKKGDAAPYKTWTYSEMPEVVTLPAGEYTLAVKSHEVEKQAWDTPYFLGNAAFTITAGEITNIGEVTCSFSSIRVTVNFADDLVKLMSPDAKVTVVANDEGTLDFTAGETRSGYFEALENSNTMVVTFTGSIDGVATTQDIPVTDVRKGNHYIFTFKTKNNPDIPDQAGTIDPNTGIGLDASMTGEDVDGNITVEEDLLDSSDRPGKEDPIEDPDKPDVPPTEETIVFTPSDGMSFDKVNEIVDGNTYAMTVTSKEPIENFKVSIESTNQDFIGSASEMMPMNFDLAHLDETTAGNLSSIGFYVNDQVLGKNEVPFDITELVPLLGAFQGTHTFTIEVVDNTGKKVSRTLTFIAR